MTDDRPRPHTDEPAARGLTQAELAAVLRRAAEIDAEDLSPVPFDQLDPLLVEAAAVEVGLSREAVRRAMAEVVHDPTAPSIYAGKGLLPTRHLVVARAVPGPVEAVEERLSRFLTRQMFERQRIFTHGSRWAPRRGWAANIRRGADPGGRMVLKQVVGIEASVIAIPDDRVMVRVTLDLSKLRSTHSSLVAGGAAAGGVVLGATGILVGLDPAALLALPVAGGLAAGGHYGGRAIASREAERIHTAIAGLFDRMEHPEVDDSVLRRRPTRSPRPTRQTGRRDSTARRDSTRQRDDTEETEQ